nr:protein ccc1 [Quercus suber]
MSRDDGDEFSENFTDLKAATWAPGDATAQAGTSPGRINPRMISDATIGLSDGLTVPFALTAGLSALGDTNVVIYGGLAELIAGGISMGLGGYLGAKSEAEAYAASLAETRRVVLQEPERAAGMVRATFDAYDFAEDALAGMVGSLARDPPRMVEFLMRFHHQLAEADYAPAKAYVSGLTISAGYVVGGLVALLPYLFLGSIHQAFVGSVAVMALALFVFGWAKTALVGESDRWVCLKNGVQMMILGGVAAGAAMGCVKAIGD